MHTPYPLIIHPHHPPPQALQHQQLVMEVMQQLNRMFTPDFRLIKKRIEDLIEREFLERDRDNTNLYKCVL